MIIICYTLQINDIFFRSGIDVTCRGDTSHTAISIGNTAAEKAVSSTLSRHRRAAHGARGLQPPSP